MIIIGIISAISIIRSKNVTTEVINSEMCVSHLHCLAESFLELLLDLIHGVWSFITGATRITWAQRREGKENSPLTILNDQWSSSVLVSVWKATAIKTIALPLKIIANMKTVVYLFSYYGILWWLCCGFFYQGTMTQVIKGEKGDVVSEMRYSRNVAHCWEAKPVWLQ